MHVLTSKNKDTLSATRLLPAMEKNRKSLQLWGGFKKRCGWMNRRARKSDAVLRQVTRSPSRNSGFIKSIRVVSICFWAGLMKQLAFCKKQSQRYNHGGEFFKIWHKTRF